MTDPAPQSQPEAPALRQPTATPWELIEATEHHGAYIVNSWGRTICDLYAMSNPMSASVRNGGNSYPVHFDDMEANAAFIVEAVNSHATLQARVEELTKALDRPRNFLAWAVRMFGPVAKLRSERLLRFVEEAIELAHAEGMEREVLNKVADRVYSRPAGNVGKEIGQAQACLETFAENIGLSSTDEAAREWTRVQEIPQEEWTRRHSAKQALGIAISLERSGGAT